MLRTVERIKVELQDQKPVAIQGIQENSKTQEQKTNPATSVNIFDLTTKWKIYQNGVCYSTKRTNAERETAGSLNTPGEKAHAPFIRKGE